MRAFVTDGSQRPALAITRSLGRRGISIFVGEETAGSLAGSSKYCSGRVVYPSPHREPDAFVDFVREFVHREKPDAVLPVADVTTGLLALNRHELGRDTGLALPSFDAFEAVTDKWSLAALASRHGIAIPRTHLVNGIAGLLRTIDAVEYPAVVKPVRSRFFTKAGWVYAGVHYVESEDELRRLYERTDHLASYPSIVQERISGPGVGMFVVFNRGELLAAFAHRRLREKPPSGGVSVLCESVPVDPQLRDDARRLLGPLGWHGVAMLEYKQDRRTGRLFLLEINGRFWGSLQLAVDAGMDIPFLTYQLARGDRPAVPPKYRVGVRNRWFLGDLDHLVARFGYSRRDLYLPDSAPSRLRLLAGFLTSCSPYVHDQVISVADPRPFWYELHEYLRSASASVVDAARIGVTVRRDRRLPLARPSNPT